MILACRISRTEERDSVFDRDAEGKRTVTDWIIAQEYSERQPTGYESGGAAFETVVITKFYLVIRCINIFLYSRTDFNGLFANFFLINASKM